MHTADQWAPPHLWMPATLPAIRLHSTFASSAASMSAHTPRSYSAGHAMLAEGRRAAPEASPGATLDAGTRSFRARAAAWSVAAV
jgi:hypothetical protein